MQVRVGSVLGGVVRVMVLTAVLGGCAQSADGDEDESRPSASTPGVSKGAGAEGKGAVSGGSIGAAGSPCELPVSFDIAEGWKAKGIDAEAELSKTAGGSDGGAPGELAESFLRQGPVTTACEIDAKPAGHLGFLRVWTGKPGAGDARAVLREFVAAEDDVSEERYRAVELGGGLSGVEVRYLYTSKLLDETKKETAFAVSTPQGPVVVHLGGLDTEEHEAMLPAYELAKRTLRAA
ncbi:lipoprotein [Streptomyces sp. NBC_00820]|uniref:lipoprotein n=1 Tax=Streptomyces sp. NBC_00820 TaxID=2975842 RepID=UPI002ED32244|nr:lipoprotein [Streptomyces sp. NBC_00820]